MNYRINAKAIILVGVLVIIVAGLFVYTLISAPTEVVREESNASSSPTEVQTDGMLLTAKHQFLDGVHTVVGTAQVPTSCHRLIAEPFSLKNEEDDAVLIEIRFSTLLEGEACPHELYEVPFRVTFEAPENAILSATWNGAPARLNLVPVGPGESIEDELYIKG